MAMATLTPADNDAAEPARDLVTFNEAALLFKQTGEPEFEGLRLTALKRKLQRWAKEDSVRTVRSGQSSMVSFSDLLQAHARRYPPADCQ